jgi:dolichol kinase
LRGIFIFGAFGAAVGFTFTWLTSFLAFGAAATLGLAATALGDACAAGFGRAFARAGR